jgi:hypothetical protein
MRGDIPEFDSLFQDLSCILLPMMLREDPTVQHDSILTGNEYYLELMRSENLNRLHDYARMDRETFLILLDLLRDYGGLQNLNRSVFISAGEKLMICIYILKGNSMRETNERWQKFSSTIHRILYQVISSFGKIRKYVMAPASASTPVLEQIREDPTFYPFFRNCVGAFDGSHLD